MPANSRWDLIRALKGLNAISPFRRSVVSVCSVSLASRSAHVKAQDSKTKSPQIPHGLLYNWPGVAARSQRLKGCKRPRERGKLPVKNLSTKHCRQISVLSGKRTVETSVVMHNTSSLPDWRTTLATCHIYVLPSHWYCFQHSLSQTRASEWVTLYCTTYWMS